MQIEPTSQVLLVSKANHDDTKVYNENNSRNLGRTTPDQLHYAIEDMHMDVRVYLESEIQERWVVIWQLGAQVLKIKGLKNLSRHEPMSVR